jgi:hypothetical protein
MLKLWLLQTLFWASELPRPDVWMTYEEFMAPVRSLLTA